MSCSSVIPLFIYLASNATVNDTTDTAICKRMRSFEAVRGAILAQPAQSSCDIDRISSKGKQEAIFILFKCYLRNVLLSCVFLGTISRR